MLGKLPAPGAAHEGDDVSEQAMPTAAPTEWVGTPRARRRAGLSIYSILLIMLLSVSVLSSIVVRLAVDALEDDGRVGAAEVVILKVDANVRTWR